MPAGPTVRGSSPSTRSPSSNVQQLQVAWTYPAGQTDFNPLVVRGIVYGRGPKDPFVALDAATGKQFWIHEGVQGFNTPRRQLLGEQGRQRPPADLQLDQHPAGDRRAHRRADLVVRQGRPGRSARRPRSRSVDDQPADPHARARVREPADPRLGDEPGVRLGAGRHSRVRRAHRARSCGRSTPCRARASSATTPGRRTRGRPSAAPTTGASSRSTRSAASSTSRPAARSTTSTAATARAPICSATASSRSTRAPASGSGISRWSTTTSGISTTTRRRS